jgi:hypothetical protein
VAVTVTSVARDATTIAKFDAYYATLPHTSASADAASIAAYMAMQPGVTTAGSSPYLAFAVMNDGLFYVQFLDQNQPGVVLGTSASPARRTVPRTIHRDQSGGTFVTLPAGNAYVFSNTAAYGSVAPETGIANALRAAGYNATSEEATVANFMSMSDASLFYTFNHSGIVSRPGKIPTTFALATSDIFNPKSIPPAYLPLLSATQNGNVPAGTVPQLFVGGFDVNGAPVHTYGVTTQFFAQQSSITFASGALAFVNSCESADSNFIAALVSKGVGTYMGWPAEAGQSDGRETGNFFFDRLLGEGNPQVISAFSGGPAAEKPPERSFSLAEVATYASNFKRQDGSPWNINTSCVLANFPNVCSDLQITGAMNLLLAASIQEAMVDESSSTLYLQGEFGSEPGTVSIGTTPTDTTSFTVTPAFTATQYLYATIPQAGNGSAGYIAVSNNGVPSNAVPLTLYGPMHVNQKWHVPTDVLGDQTITADGSAVGNFYFRGDVHSMRTAPGTTPQPLMFGDDYANQGSVLLPQSTSNAALALNYASQFSVQANGSGAQTYCASFGPNCYTGSFVGCMAGQPCSIAISGSINNLPQTVTPPCGDNPSCPFGPDGSCFESPTCEFSFGYGANSSIMKIGLDASYAITAASGSGPSCNFDLDNFFYIYPSQLAGTCTYDLGTTPGKYPPLPTTAS